MSDFQRYSALSFDCYGTLIDWDTGIGLQLESWAERRAVDVARPELLASFASLETVVQQEQSPALLYREVLAETLRRIGARFEGLVTEADATAFGSSVDNWPAFADSTHSLQRLASRFQLFIVSNVDKRSFEASRRRLGVDFDAVVTAEEVGAYKPADAHFERLFDILDERGLSRGQLLHVAESLYHDHQPAQRHGIDSAWIQRRQTADGHGATAPPTDPKVDPNFRFESIKHFADAALRDNRHSTG